jgi:hypothetical protein
MDQLPRRVDLLQELETRQDEVLRQLDELNARLEKLLAEYTPQKPVIAGPAGPAHPKVAA